MYVNVSLPIPVPTLFSYKVPEDLEKKIQIGQRVLVPFGNRKKIGYVIEIKDEFYSSQKIIKEIIKLIDINPLIPPKLLNLAQKISDYYLCSLGETLNNIFPINLKPDRNYKFKKEASFLTPLKESNEQIFLFHQLCEEKKNMFFYQQIEKILKNGRQCIFIVPEISLTYTALEKLEKIFKFKMAIWHSALSNQQRYILWEKSFLGEYDLIVGTRSAIFLPFPSLGLIIVEEENYFGYKQERRPMFNLSDVACWRAKEEKCSCILSSSSPSILNYYYAKKGKYKLVEELNLKLPPMKVIDMGKERKKSYKGLISTPLMEAIEEKLTEKELILLYHNRKGYWTFTICKGCGYVFRCPSCGTSLITSPQEDFLQCYYCGYQERKPDFCPSCGSKKIFYGGTGTNKMEKIILELFPQANISRLEQDLTKDKNFYQKVRQNLENKKIDIIIGTQVLINKLDIPKVGLLGIISADSAFNFPNFRSGETTFSTIIKLSQYVDPDGEIILQTHNPDHYVIKTVKNYNYQEFYEKEIEFRKILNYPPFTQLINILVRAEKKDIAEQTADNIAQYLKKETNPKKTVVLGPAPVKPLYRGGKYRLQVVLKTSQSAEIKDKLFNLYSFSRPKVKISIDVDPI